MYSNISLLNLKRPLSTYNPDPIETRAWVRKRQYVSLILSGKLFRLKHLSFRLQVIEKHPLLTIDPLLCLHRV
jgi:hypothetical protein